MYMSLTPHRKYKLPFDEIGFRYWEPIIHQTASFASGILQTLRRSALWFPQFQTLPFGALSTRSLRSEIVYPAMVVVGHAQSACAQFIKAGISTVAAGKSPPREIIEPSCFPPKGGLLPCS